MKIGLISADIGRLYYSIQYEYLPTVDVANPVIQAEIRPGIFEIIDGNHRMERAYREELEFIDSYKLRGEQFCHILLMCVVTKHLLSIGIQSCKSKQGSWDCVVFADK